MTRQPRRLAWGFPRWSDYGLSHEAVRVRMCDVPGCSEAGEHPAPQRRDSPDRWWFCQTHAGEYNRNWNYFAGLTDEEIAAREQAAQQEGGYARAKQWAWTAAGPSGVSAGVRDALRLFELDSDATEKAIKTAYRRLAKLYHPDSNPGDAEAAERFQAVRVAYDLLVGWIANRPA